MSNSISMFKNTARKLSQAHLDKRLKSLKSLDILQTPPRGWIYTIRTTLGMTLAQLGQRLRISPQAVAQLEKREVAGQITLSTLREALGAMGVQHAHTVFTSASLQEIVHHQAERKAREIVLRTSQTMHLENQKNSDKRLAEAIREKTRELEERLPSSLWD